MELNNTTASVAGDELGQTHFGNNNWYGHDNEISHMNWNISDPDRVGFLRFTSELIKFRKKCPLLSRDHFLG